MTSTENVELRAANEKKKKETIECEIKRTIQVSINENAEQRYENIKIQPNSPTRVKAIMVCWKEEDKELSRIMNIFSLFLLQPYLQSNFQQ